MKKRVRAEDRIGQRFGRLVVVSVAGKNKHGQTVLGCVCDCGSAFEVDSASVVTGKTCSCGCFRVETTRNRGTTHGKSRKGASGEYTCWLNIKGRCLNSHDSEYHNYGGRGIAVCASWLESFEQFYADMGPRPSSKHSIDRIDNNGNYCKENCRWATSREQSRNRRNNRVVVHNGISMVLTDWASHCGIHYDCLRARLDLGWTVKDALTTPSGVRRANNQ